MSLLGITGIIMSPTDTVSEPKDLSEHVASKYSHWTMIVSGISGISEIIWLTKWMLTEERQLGESRKRCSAHQNRDKATRV